jgi:hypothetical protein
MAYAPAGPPPGPISSPSIDPRLRKSETGCATRDRARYRMRGPWQATCTKRRLPPMGWLWRRRLNWQAHKEPVTCRCPSFQPAHALSCLRTRCKAAALVAGDPALIEAPNLETFLVTWAGAAPDAPVHDTHPENTLIKGVVRRGDAGGIEQRRASGAWSYVHRLCSTWLN